MLNIKLADLKFTLQVFDQVFSEVQAGKVTYYKWVIIFMESFHIQKINKNKYNNSDNIFI